MQPSSATSTWSCRRYDPPSRINASGGPKAEITRHCGNAGRPFPCKVVIASLGPTHNTGAVVRLGRKCSARWAGAVPLPSTFRALEAHWRAGHPPPRGGGRRHPRLLHATIDASLKNFQRWKIQKIFFGALERRIQLHPRIRHLPTECLFAGALYVGAQGCAGSDFAVSALGRGRENMFRCWRSRRH